MNITLRPVIVNHRDGSFYVTPQADLGATLLDGMIDAQKFARQPISWDEITMGYIKGHVLATGERLVIHPADLPMKDEDVLVEWIYEND
jgi:hypothetical protein